MARRKLTDLGLRVDQFIFDSCGGRDKDIGKVLIRVLVDERIASKLGLAYRDRGRPGGSGGKHSVVAAEYLIELHLLRGERGSATKAAETVCSRYGIDERQLRKYRKDHRLSAYAMYRLAVYDGEFGLTGEPDIPPDVEAELNELAEQLRKRTKNLTDLLS